MHRASLLLFALVTVGGAAGCPHAAVKNPAPELTADDMLARLAAARAKATSFRSESVMDYWLGNDRVKGTVKVMGTPGAQVRFNALSPTDDVIADLACDGTNYVYVDSRNNCVMTGPCNRDSIGQLLRVSLTPQDFFYLALGQSPVLADATATMTWNSDDGTQRLELTSREGSQSIVLDGKTETYDVLRSEQRDVDGKVVWSVTNTDFAITSDEAGLTLRVPGKTRFRSPDEKADLIIDWKTRELNVPLDARRFELTPPAGLPRCGGAS